MANRIGYCALCADILHYGHIGFIMKCRKQCDYLIVGVMTDGCIKKYKGELPIMQYCEREAIVSAIIGVDYVVPQHTFEFSDIKRQLNIDIIFDSEEHNRKGADILIPSAKWISSTQIKEKIIEAHNCKCKKKRRSKRR